MLISLMLFFQVATTQVQQPPTTTNLALTAQQCGVNASFFGFPTWYKYIKDFDNDCNPNVSFMEKDGVKADGTPKTTFNGSALVLIAFAIIDILLRAAALVAVAFVLVGSYQILSSQGEPDGVSKGRTTLMNALVGLIIALIATGVVTFLGGVIGT